MPEKGLYSSAKPYQLLTGTLRGIQDSLSVDGDYNDISNFTSSAQINISEQGKVGQADIQDGISMRFADGSVNVPGIGFSGDGDTGRYRIGDGNVGESIDGVLAYDWNATRIKLGALDLHWTTDNAKDIGAAADNRPRSIYLGTDLVAGGNLRWKSGTAFQAELDHAHTVDRIHTLQDVTGTIYETGGQDVSIADGGTNSSTALNNARLMVSSAGAIVEAGAQTNGQLPIGSTGAAPVMAALTPGTNIAVTNAAGAITVGITGAVAIANGGTGSITAAAARTALDVPSNAEAILDTIADAKGDLILGTAADTVARLAVGTNDYLLTPDSAEATGVKWVVAPLYHGVAVTKQETTTLVNVTWTTLTFDGAEEFDSDAYHSPTVNPSRITIPTGLDGKYLVTGTIQFDANTVGERFVRILKNGATLRHVFSWLGPHGGANWTGIPFAGVFSLVAGDYIELQAFQSSGGNLTVQDYSSWQVSLVGR